MTVLYVHGKGGTASESERFKKLFQKDEVVGLDYKGETPWEAGKEIFAAVESISDDILLIANSIGAYFSMCAGIGKKVKRAYFISPVVDMEKLIKDLMRLSNVTEEDLRDKKIIPIGTETLSWEYLTYVRAHPVLWEAPTRILYGSKDYLVSYETMRAFAEENRALLTVMEGGEHWFHTPEQLQYLDEWIKNGERDV